ncbi:MAG: D-2-hydroxyacid dehydrogenase [Verrucomicrobiota bacterium]
MRIVVLDGYTLNPGDLSWRKLQQFGECTVYDRTPEEKIIERSRDAEILLTNKTPLARRTIENLPELKYIGVLATGFNVVDVAAAAELGIPVANVPTYGSSSVAQMTFALLLELTQHVAHHAQTVKQGRWSSSSDFCYWDYPLIELAGLTMGIVGFGRIGRATARVARGFGMKVIAHDPMAAENDDDSDMTSLETLLQESDVVSLHCPLTENNKGMINSERLKMMKSTAFLINTARGPLIDEPALADALNQEQIAGAGLDVLAEEPPRSGSPLFDAKNCLVTPHISWATSAARARLLDIAVDNVGAFLAGSPENVVNN